MTLYKTETAHVIVNDGAVNNGTGLSVTISAAPAARFSLAAVTTTPTAGVADNLTITAQDAYGNTAAGYAGSHNLTFAGANTIGANHPTVTSSTGTATNFGTATAITFTSGIASVSGSNNGVMKLYKAETAPITASDGSITTASSLSITVNVAASPPSGLAYVDNATTTPDRVTGTTSPRASVTATQTQGDHVGNTYNATATTGGSFTINVEAYNGGGGQNRAFTYSVSATDAYGNQTSATTVSATDTK